MRAARELRNVTQSALADLVVEDGLDRHELGKLERGDEKFPLVRTRLDALVRHLRVPERWFTSVDTDLIVGLVPAELSPEQREALRLVLELLPELGRQPVPAPQQRPGGAGGQGRPGGREG
jgi:transcriptional regulator with XRE-family HTH domain